MKELKLKVGKKEIVKKIYRDKDNLNVVVEEFDVPAGINLEEYVNKFEKVEV